MTLTQLETSRARAEAPARPMLDQLRERIGRMQTRSLPGRGLPTHPALAGLLELQAGGVYGVAHASLGLTLLAGPSRMGAWSAVVGVADFGVEAAAECGVDLDRTVLVPDPGEHWLEVTVALVDVATMVLVRPPGRVAAGVAAKLGARLRKRGAALAVLGDAWPRCDARLWLLDPAWSGMGSGHGHLQARRIVVAAQRGDGPVRQANLWLPAPDAAPRLAGPVSHDLIQDAG